MRSTPCLRGASRTRGVVREQPGELAGREVRVERQARALARPRRRAARAAAPGACPARRRSASAARRSRASHASTDSPWWARPAQHRRVPRRRRASTSADRVLDRGEHRPRVLLDAARRGVRRRDRRGAPRRSGRRRGVEQRRLDRRRALVDAEQQRLAHGARRRVRAARAARSPPRLEAACGRGRGERAGRSPSSIAPASAEHAGERARRSRARPTARSSGSPPAWTSAGHASRSARARSSRRRARRAAARRRRRSARHPRARGKLRAGPREDQLGGVRLDRPVAPCRSARARSGPRSRGRRSSGTRARPCPPRRAAAAGSPRAAPGRAARRRGTRPCAGRARTAARPRARATSSACSPAQFAAARTRSRSPPASSTATPPPARRERPLTRAPDAARSRRRPRAPAASARAKATGSVTASPGTRSSPGAQQLGLDAVARGVLGELARPPRSCSGPSRAQPRAAAQQRRRRGSAASSSRSSAARRISSVSSSPGLASRSPCAGSPSSLPLAPSASSSSASSSSDADAARGERVGERRNRPRPPPTIATCSSRAGHRHTLCRRRRRQLAYDRAVRIEPFEIERFYERWEFRAELMLSSSDCESRAARGAAGAGARCRASGCARCASATPKCPARRSCARRSRGTYERVAPDDVLTLAAAEEGIFIAYHALLGPGDHAVVEAPCYGSALNLARSTGAEVTPWQRRYEDGWAYDLDELERAAARRTRRFVYVNSPHNPTGSQMTAEEQRAPGRAARRARGRPVQRRGLPRPRARRARRGCRRPATSTSGRCR